MRSVIVFLKDAVAFERFALLLASSVRVTQKKMAGSPLQSLSKVCRHFTIPGLGFGMIPLSLI